jgi:hypothetical protein
MIAINKYIFGCLSMILSLPVLVCAQDVDTLLRHRLYLSIAFNHTDARDDQASPILYFGNGQPFGLGYEYRGNSYRHSLRFSFSVANVNANELHPDLQNDPLKRRTFFGNAFLIYSYLRDCNWSEGKLHYSIGGSLDNVAFLRNYKFSGTDLFSSEGVATWEELNMLSPIIRADFDLNTDEKFYSELSLPLVSLVGRPSYNFSASNSNFITGKDFHIVFLGGLLGWNYALRFEQKIWDALLLTASYNSRYYRYSRYGWATAILMQDIALQLNWRFGL